MKLEEVAGLYPHIHVFGKTSELYEKAMFEDNMQEEAKKFDDAYYAMYQLMQPKDEQEKSKDQKGKKKEPTKLEILYNKIRSNSQNLANAYHRYTKLMLLSEINKDGNYVLPEGLKFALSECKEKQHKDFYNQGWEEKSEYNAAVDKVAQCEHLRWWAAHVCLGYVPMEASEYFATGQSHNETTMQHACMIPWQELSKLNNNEGEDKFKAYDRLVVAVTCDRIEGKKLSFNMTKYPTKMKHTPYTPQPIDTKDIELPKELDKLAEDIAKNVHEVWSLGRMKDGWTYGSERNDAQKKHPCLVPYEELSEAEKAYDRNTSIETIKLILKLGFKITKP